jgi:hypothetical protein
VASKQCPKCSGSMVEGYVIDRTYGSVAVGSWVEGTAERSVWTGLKLAGKARIDIATWRCGRCGFLEQYAAGAQSRYEAHQKQVQRVVLIVAVLSAILAAGVAILLAH